MPRALLSVACEEISTGVLFCASPFSFLFTLLSLPTSALSQQAQSLLKLVAGSPNLPRRLVELNEDDQQLADAMETGEVQEVVKALKEIDRLKQEKKDQKAAALRRLETDPFDVEAQMVLEEMVCVCVCVCVLE